MGVEQVWGLFLGIFYLIVYEVGRLILQLFNSLKP